jgi:hypothetical protein
MKERKRKVREEKRTGRAKKDESQRKEKEAAPLRSGKEVEGKEEISADSGPTF